MNRQTAHEMLKEAFMAASLNGKLATHSLRESFAQRIYEESGDIYLVQELLGHRSVSTTQKYIGVSYASARAAVEAIALGSQPYRTPFWAVHSKKRQTKHSFSNSHAAGTTSPVSGRKPRQPQRLSRSDKFRDRVIQFECERKSWS